MIRIVYFHLLVWASLCAKSLGLREFNGALNIAIVHPIGSNSSARALASTVLAIEHINDKNDSIFDNLLPNTTIQFEYYNSFSNNEEIAKIAANLKYEAFGGLGADVVIGGSSSSRSITLQSFLKHFSLPQISPYASSGRLSNVEEFPFFLRTVPTDEYMINAMVQFATVTVGWKNAAVINGNDAYSKDAASVFISAAKTHPGFEILHQEVFLSGIDNMNLQEF